MHSRLFISYTDEINVSTNHYVLLISLFESAPICSRQYFGGPEFPFTWPLHTLRWTRQASDPEEHHWCPPHQYLNLFLLPVTEREGCLLSCTTVFCSWVWSLCTFRLIQLLRHILLRPQPTAAAASLQHNSLIVSNYPNGVCLHYVFKWIFTLIMQTLWAALQLYENVAESQITQKHPSACMYTSALIAICCRCAITDAAHTAFNSYYLKESLALTCFPCDNFIFIVIVLYQMWQRWCSTAP